VKKSFEEIYFSTSAFGSIKGLEGIVADFVVVVIVRWFIVVQKYTFFQK
jgi:hypothetical protein